MNVELFPCSGGMAEGFRRAGVNFDLAFDYSKDACDSYEKNLGHRPIQIDVHDLVRLAEAGFEHTRENGIGIRVGHHAIDLLVADPPCTPWSRAGKRQGLDDERDCLDATFALLKRWRPQAFLIGNVPGLDDANNWHVITDRLGELGKLGYCVRDFLRLDAADYGVPQHRVRPFWYGHRIGDCLRVPPRTHCDPNELHTVSMFETLKPWVTCRDALSHLSGDDLGRPVKLRWRLSKKTSNFPRASAIDEPAHTVTAKEGSGDGNVITVHDTTRRSHPSRTDRPARSVRAAQPNPVLSSPNHQPSTLDEPAKTLTRNTHADGSLIYVGDPDGLLTHPRHPINRPDEPSHTVTARDRGGAQGAGAIEWPWPRPATTVTCRAGLPPPGHHPEAGSIMSLPDAIVLSERAGAILQGFPETWTFCGKTKKARWAQLGMAMPPPMAEAVAREIVRALRLREVA